ncbi:DNA-deoxyinosine glycosylase [Dechloromonas denitrificans]|uniref:DNA-deoxyinosine glycosylase n=1 Tax=Dechloromonas denitrificans TaxID=281362 RepID=UPI001CF8E133|nr:DNA-deoxyinosine glycosylase [Dechloromonas denitrificans]UCV11368.1 DNA-deoxyinosine glycosylase [Dechloromonas denitrificans]
MSLLAGFPPLVAPGARALILGSMPGKASLAAARYYAHERNSFWRIMGDLLDAGPDRPYAERLHRLAGAGIAVWDVIAACERESSLDADIVSATVRVNDFQSFFAVYRDIRVIFFNGAAAETNFRRHVLPGLEEGRFVLQRLPSTSPAHAALTYAEKLAAWSAIVALPNN